MRGGRGDPSFWKTFELNLHLHHAFPRFRALPPNRDYFSNDDIQKSLVLARLLDEHFEPQEGA